MSYHLLYLLLTGGCCLLLCGCVDPVSPRYDFVDKLIYIEGEITNIPGQGEVLIRRSIYDGQQYLNNPLSGAEVDILTGSGTSLRLAEVEAGRYILADGAAGQPGQSYSLRIRTPEGQVYQSIPEVMPAPVALTDFYLDFDPEASYDLSRQRFIPAFRLYVDWQDAAAQRNRYQWRYKRYEYTSICASCYGGVWRNGECKLTPGISSGNRYDYTCDRSCWAVEYSNSIEVFTDNLADGQFIRGRQIGHIPFNSRAATLVEVQQYSLTGEAYEYYLLLQQTLQGGGGLNSPPPAALVGNFLTPDDPEEQVLGYFAAAGLSVLRKYISRAEAEGNPSPVFMPRYEPTLFPPSAPCVESRGRTPLKPEGWP